MFKCELTNRMSKPGDKCNKVVIERRERTYLNEVGEVVGQGWEIVKEISVTDAGLALWNKEQKLV